MNRRGFIGVSTIPCVVALAGCTESIHRARGVDTPVGLGISNQSGTQLLVMVQIERERKTVFDGGCMFAENGAVESISGDDFRDAEFSEAGSYIVTADIDGSQHQTTMNVSWRYLTDCNSNSIQIQIWEDEVEIAFIRTDAACAFPDTLGSK